MEAIKNALGYGTEQSSTTDSRIGGGEAPQYNNSFSNSQSGVEPESGKLGSGTAGEPYDGGNDEDMTRTTGYGDVNTSTLGAGGSRQQGNPYEGGSSGRGADYSSGQTGYGQTGSGYGQTGSNSGSTLGKIGSALGVGGASHGAQDNLYGAGSNTSGLSGGSSGLTGGQSSSSGGLSSGLSGSNQTSSRSGGGFGDITGPGSRAQTHGHAILGSEFGGGKGGDRYLYDSRSAPGFGGRSHDDDFTHKNIHNVGSGSISEDVGSVAGAGKSDGGVSKPGLNRTGTGMGGGSSGLTSGYSSNSQGRTSDSATGQSSATSGYGSGAAAGITSGLAAIGLGSKSRTGDSTQSGTEPISGRQGSGVAGEAYDAGNTRGYDGQAPQKTTTTTNTYSEPLSDRQRGSNVQDTGYGNRDVSSNTSDFKAGAPVSGYTHSGSGPAGGSHNVDGLVGSHTGNGRNAGITDELDDGCEGARGYEPHGGHPIGEKAHQTSEGKSTWLNYHDDPKVVLGEKLRDAV
ncbi:hypothetical protein MBLNU459_g7350t1 [Dothideomycetes sp. NU459]